MNGSDHLGESDASPLHLCPVCLRKLQSSAGFDVADRYRKIRDFFTKAALPEEAAWFDARLRWIEKGGSGGQEAAPERGGERVTMAPIRAT